MDNRYAALAAHNDKILEATPGAEWLWWLAAQMTWIGIPKEGARLVELGCGEGHLTKQLCAGLVSAGCCPEQFIAIDLDLKMVSSCKEKMIVCHDWFRIMPGEAMTWLTGHPVGHFHAITSAWMIHNMEWTQKLLLFKAIYRALRPSGKFILMDKVFVDDEKAAQQMQDEQYQRYRMRLESPVAEAVIRHEEEDAQKLYRMEHSNLFDAIKHVGFRNPWCVDRVNRDVVIVCTK